MCSTVARTGGRVAVYVPEELVPEVQRSLDNGRALQDLLAPGGTAIHQSAESERAPKPKKSGWG